jgi:predicted phosphodiesterase
VIIPKKQLVGIMADSHGQIGSISDGIRFLSKMGCRPIFHLGDICDSSHPETADECVKVLEKNGVSAIKGNNDHLILSSYSERNGNIISDSTVKYLRNLPHVIEYDRAILAHSLPFYTELGFSCMIWDMGEKEISRFFKDKTKKILFRGHSHKPVISWRENNKIITEEFFSDHEINLVERFPCVVTCGSLTRGLCLIWDTEHMKIKSKSFRQTDPDRLC